MIGTSNYLDINKIPRHFCDSGDVPDGTSTNVVPNQHGGVGTGIWIFHIGRHERLGGGSEKTFKFRGREQVYGVAVVIVELFSFEMCGAFDMDGIYAGKF